MRVETGAFGFGLEAFGHDLIGCLASKPALAAGIAGSIEAAQQRLELAVRVDGGASRWRCE